MRRLLIIIAAVGILTGIIAVIGYFTPLGDAFFRSSDKVFYKFVEKDAEIDKYYGSGRSTSGANNATYSYDGYYDTQKKS